MPTSFLLLLLLFFSFILTTPHPPILRYFSSSSSICTIGRSFDLVHVNQQQNHHEQKVTTLLESTFLCQLSTCQSPADLINLCGYAQIHYFVANLHHEAADDGGVDGGGEEDGLARTHLGLQRLGHLTLLGLGELLGAGDGHLHLPALGPHELGVGGDHLARLPKPGVGGHGGEQVLGERADGGPGKELVHRAHLGLPGDGGVAQVGGELGVLGQHVLEAQHLGLHLLQRARLARGHVERVGVARVQAEEPLGRHVGGLGGEGPGGRGRPQGQGSAQGGG
mmetsp:Transcript_14560/g.22143  ORF Transcript_14560/g.22143 Transcript_14560/m.22143 type:complete len:280 (+) Transcript_14560:409-1248(+)